MIQKVKNRLKEQKGFTLIELLAVIVILGIIAAIAIPSINGIIQKSRTDAVHAEAASVLNAAKLYSAETMIPLVADDADGITLSNTGTPDDNLGNYLETSDDFDYTITILNTAGVITYTDITVTKGNITVVYADAGEVLSKSGDVTVSN